jgi:hypothetical protein
MRCLDEVLEMFGPISLVSFCTHSAAQGSAVLCSVLQCVVLYCMVVQYGREASVRTCSNINKTLSPYSVPIPIPIPTSIPILSMVLEDWKIPIHAH